MSSFSRVISPGQRIASPGPGNGWRPTISSGRPSSRPSARTSSLNNSRNGSTSFMFMRAGSPPTLWCDLMVTEGPPVNDTLSITSGYSVPCARKTAPADLFGFDVEHVDEQPPDGLALDFGIGDACEFAEE